MLLPVRHTVIISPCAFNVCSFLSVFVVNGCLAWSCCNKCHSPVNRLFLSMIKSLAKRTYETKGSHRLTAWGYRHHYKKKNGWRMWDSWSKCVLGQEAEKDECWCHSLRFFFFIYSLWSMNIRNDAAHNKDRSSLSIKACWKHPLRCTWNMYPWCF